MTLQQPSLDPQTASTPTASAPGFDVCQGALAWRALAFVNGALLLGAMAASAHALEALALIGPLAIVGLVGTVMWLAGVCASKRFHSEWSGAMRRVAWIGWGALTALFAFQLSSWMTMGEPSAWRFIVAAALGAAMAAALTAWIELRAQAHRPITASARLAELQARIRPHFLFNTLNTATALVRVDPPAAETMLEDLSDLFRAALNEAKTSTLGEEIAVAKQYLAIEQRRFGDKRMNVEWAIDEAANDAPVPSLVLQPLVENAVHHGVESLREGAWIRVSTHATRDGAQVQVENRVGGETKTGSGMALANVRERLRLLHDLDGRVDSKREGDRFVVRISVPRRLRVAA